MTAVHTTQGVQVLDGKHLLDAGEAARFLGVSPRTLRRLTELGDLPCRKVGKIRRWRVDDLVAFAAPAR